MPRYADKQWRVMLKMLAWRDAPVELSRRSAADDGPPVVYRSRLFEANEHGQIIVERPGQLAVDKAFGVGDDIELLLMHHGDRLVATCTVLDTHLRWINPTVRVTCFLLSPGRRPQREQRRAFYRVNVAALPLDPVTLTINADDEPVIIPGKLVNLGGGGYGVSVRARRKLLGQLRRTRDLSCAVQFDDGTTIQTPVRVAHIERRGDDLLYLGLEVQIEDEAHARAVEDQLLHLCAQFQRAQLQKRKA